MIEISFAIRLTGLASFELPSMTKLLEGVTDVDVAGEG